MAAVTLQGTGKVLTTDFKSVKWEGLTKAGKMCTITLTNAINMGNISWAFAEINADDDMGPVVDRVVITDSVATLTMNILTMLTNVASYYPAVSTT